MLGVFTSSLAMENEMFPFSDDIARELYCNLNWEHLIAKEFAEEESYREQWSEISRLLPHKATYYDYRIYGGHPDLNLGIAPTVERAWFAFNGDAAQEERNDDDAEYPRFRPDKNNSEHLRQFYWQYLDQKRRNAQAPGSIRAIWAISEISSIKDWESPQWQRMAVAMARVRRDEISLRPSAS